MENVLEYRGLTVIELGRNYDSLDDAAIRRAERLLREKAESIDPPLMVVDMTRTTGIGSIFVGTLFAVEKRLKSRQGRLAACCPNPFCAEVLQIVKADRVFKTFATRDEAVDDLLTNSASKD
jgi:anti-anti-sigma regulatory factor